MKNKKTLALATHSEGSDQCLQDARRFHWFCHAVAHLLCTDIVS